MVGARDVFESFAVTSIVHRRKLETSFGVEYYFLSITIGDDFETVLDETSRNALNWGAFCVFVIERTEFVRHDGASLRRIARHRR